MTEIRSWLLGIMAVSVLGTILTALTEKTAGGTIVKTAVSLAMILTVVYPLGAGIDLQPTFSFESADTSAYLTETQEQTRSLAEQALAEHLVSYAAEAGVVCNISVACRLSGAGEIAPQQVVVRYRSDAAAVKTLLSDKIVREFGISAEQIEYIEGL